MIPPLVTAYAAGGATAILAELAGRKIRRMRQQQSTPAPRTAVLNPEGDDPRAEAKAILEISNWSFPQAYSWTRVMMREDPDSKYWPLVFECIEIYEAGKEFAR